MRKKYLIKLEGNIIGHTYFERCKSPMGVVIGDIKFNDVKSGYEFFIKYCIEHNIQVNAHDEVHRFIGIQDIEQLKVINEIGTEIKGQRVSLRGFDYEGIEITVSGIPHPFYGEEFPYYGEEYDNQFK